MTIDKQCLSSLSCCCVTAARLTPSAGVDAERSVRSNGRDARQSATDVDWLTEITTTVAARLGRQAADIVSGYQGSDVHVAFDEVRRHGHVATDMDRQKLRTTTTTTTCL